MSEKRDLWVPLLLAAAGIALLVAHLASDQGTPLTGVLAALLGLGGAIACLPLRLRLGQGRVLTFGLGVLLLLVPLIPGLVSSPAGVLAWFLVALAFLVPLRVAPESTRKVMLGAAALFGLLGAISALGVMPQELAWLFLAGALFMALQVQASRPAVEAEAPPGPRVCVFGGSFDPFHRGHRALCEAALKTNDRLLVVVAGNAPHKFLGEDGAPEITPFHHRVAMTRLGLSGLPRTEVLELEGRREGPSYTVDTLEVIERSHPPGTRFRLLLGADMYSDFPTWRSWRDIAKRAELLVAHRPGHDLDDPPELEGIGVRATRMEAPRVAVSSTTIRRRVAGGEGVSDLLDEGVLRYVEEHDLYASSHP